MSCQVKNPYYPNNSPYSNSQPINPYLNIYSTRSNSRWDLLCLNPKCGHKWSDPDVQLNIKKIQTLEQLITLGESYHCIKRIRYYEQKFYNRHSKETKGLDLSKLYKILQPIKNLINMIGLDNVKSSVLGQILFLLKYGNRGTRNLHTVIIGTPGTGKTELANILADIYCKLGILKNGNLVAVKRSDLIGEFLGSTAIKTQKVINSALDGVLFIDEAYSLGNKEQRDNFSKECIDTLTHNLLLHKERLVCIIAGYEEDLTKCFFAYNGGLERRFSFWHRIEKYNSEELFKILIKKINDSGWKYNNTVNKKISNSKKIDTNKKRKNKCDEKEEQVSNNKKRKINCEEKKEVLNQINLDSKEIQEVKDLIESDLHLLKLKELISTNYDLFKNFGGDMEFLIERSQIISCSRSVLTSEENVMTYDDINKSITMLKAKQIDKKDENNHLSMYA